jgi:selenocysteine lyase/cysteine desulfurase
MLPLNSNISLGSVDYRTLGILHTRPDFTVFRVHNTDLKRDEALRISHSDDWEGRDRVLISQLNHPANVRLISSGTIDTGSRRSVLLLTLPEWTSLAEEFAEQTAPPLRVCRLLGQLLGALSDTDAH